MPKTCDPSLFPNTAALMTLADRLQAMLNYMIGSYPPQAWHTPNR
jgi:hypothetical protein